MSSYPDDFWDWPEAKRNAFFKAEADAFEVQEKAKATGDGVAGQPKTRRNGPDARAPKKPKFQLTPFNNIKFEAAEEWLIKKLPPRKGVAAFYGASGSVKTFILLDLVRRARLALGGAPCRSGTNHLYRGRRRGWLAQAQDRLGIGT